MNGLELYYETHGTGRPLDLLHGAFSAIGTSSGEVLSSLAERRQVTAFEMPAHSGHAPLEHAPRGA